MPENREILYRTIVQTSLPYYSMKFEIQRSYNKGGITIYKFLTVVLFLGHMTRNQKIASNGIDGHFPKNGQRALIVGRGNNIESSKNIDP